MFEIATEIFLQISWYYSINQNASFLPCSCSQSEDMPKFAMIDICCFPSYISFVSSIKVPRELYSAVKLFFLVFNFHRTLAIDELFPISSLLFLQTNNETTIPILLDLHFYLAERANCPQYLFSLSLWINYIRNNCFCWGLWIYCNLFENVFLDSFENKSLSGWNVHLLHILSKAPNCWPL